MGFNHFDLIVYINLDHRKDRKKEIEHELKNLNLYKKAYRIPAYCDPLNGTKGCLISHIYALNFAIRKGAKNVLILEDDCIFIKNKNICSN